MGLPLVIAGNAVIVASVAAIWTIGFLVAIWWVSGKIARRSLDRPSAAPA